MNFNSTVACGINTCSVNSDVWQTSKAKNTNWNIKNKVNTSALNSFVSELEEKCWQDLESFNNEADHHLNSSTAIAKWDDYRLWDSFAADPTRREAALEQIVINANRPKAKPINSRSSLTAKALVVESKKMEMDADEEPSRCRNLALNYYGQLKNISNVT